MKSCKSQPTLLLAAMLVTLSLFTTPLGAQTPSPTTIYDYELSTITGEPFAMSSLKGKKLMLVNVASKCGFPPQNQARPPHNQEYNDQNVIIQGIPPNNIRNQEAGSNEEIMAFCSATYGVDFPMMAKISVVGEEMAPIYRWLTSRSLNGVADSEVTWNFNKYLINADGTLYKKLESKVEPNAAEIIEWIEE